MQMLHQIFKLINTRLNNIYLFIFLVLKNPLNIYLTDFEQSCSTSLSLDLFHQQSCFYFSEGMTLVLFFEFQSA